MTTRARKHLPKRSFRPIAAPGVYVELRLVAMTEVRSQGYLGSGIGTRVEAQDVESPPDVRVEIRPRRSRQ
jgi:hypothetical protein